MDYSGVYTAGKKLCIIKAEGVTVGTRAVIKSISNNMKRIEAACKKASLAALPPSKNAAAREWLCDNYYMIDREGRTAAAGLKSKQRLPASPDKMPIVYCIARALLTEVGAVDAEKLEAFLSGVQEGYTLSNTELSVFKDMLTAAVVDALAKECESIESESGGDAGKMSRLIGTLRVMSGADMSLCIERLSVSEALLTRDPSGVYPDMSEETKRYYRYCVELGARRDGISEAEFAERALKSAENAGGTRFDKHIGKYIIPEHKKSVGKLFPAFYYSAPLVLFALIAVLTGNVMLSALTAVPLWSLWYAVQENIASAVVKRRFVCSLDPAKLSPDTCATVAISCLITSSDQIKKLAKNLTQVRLSGRVERCGLLADFKESDTLSKPEDAHLLSVLEKEIRKLNDEFGGGFFALVRKRSFSASEGKYMGRERKRGAINELIRYMNTGECDFASITGDLRGVVGSDYLLALDADTTLSINAAAELTAVLEHPMNKAVVEGGAVVRGYGIAVPRLTNDIESSSRSLFSRVFAGAGGLHSYGGAGADLYRDVFGDGLFTGKGLIDVKAFSAVLDGALPDNRVLSHDIIEGCVLRACSVSETELSDSFPTTVKAWLVRQGRWIRGDYQNAFFLREKRKNANGKVVKNAFSYSDRFKLFDNIRRALNPVFVFASAAACAFATGGYRLPLLALVLASASAGETVATVRSLFKPRIVFRRYITRGVTAFLGGCLRIAVNVMLLPQLAAVSFIELCKVVWRVLVTRRNMLEWVTAAEAENAGKNSVTDYYLYFRFTAVLGVACLFSGILSLAVLGALWVIAPAVFCEMSRPYVGKKASLDEDDEELLYSFAASMWRFFDNYVTAETNHLPPDNVQYMPYRVAMRTSPTNIGLYLICALAARDLGFIDSAELCARLSDSIAVIKKLDTWNGNLYNWYDLKTLAPLEPEYVSTVDSGNLLCCLTALKEGVAEYAWECAGLKEVAEACREILNNADLSALYNERRRLFYIGYDVSSGSFGNNMYDILMSEARMTSYYAIAKKVADKRHWGTLGRLFAGSNGYVGPLSWTGTMFEYFMPHLLLPVVSDSLTDEALKYALYCQKKRTDPLKLPWGVSESGFCSLDIGQNYRYKAFGVQKLGLKRGLDDELVVSPYSTFLALPFAPAGAIANLRRLINLGINGEFGLYEAIDFTASRTGGGFAVVKSYMAHHMGMSLVSIVNCLLDNVMQKRFIRDADMRTAQKLLEEAVYDGAALYKGVVTTDVKFKTRRLPEEGTVCREFDPAYPRALLLSNGEFSTVITDGGSGFSMWNCIDLSRRKRDLRTDPAGVYVFLKEEKKPAFSVTADPVRGSALRRAEFTAASAVFTAVQGGLEAAMSVSVHGRIPAEIRVVKIGNTERRRKDAEVLFYAEPVLAHFKDHSAHPAFSDLFIMCEYREAERCLLVWRRGDVGQEACVAYGFADAGIAFGFETDRSEVLNKAEGVFSLGGAFDKEFSSSCGTPVIPCAAIRTRFSLRGGENKTAVFIQCAGRNCDEALARFMLIRKQSAYGMMKSSWETAGNMSASINCGAEENRLLNSIIPRLYFECPKTIPTAEAVKTNALGVNELWSMSVSGDKPIVTCVIAGECDIERARSHIVAHRAAAVKGAEYDLCVIFREGGAYDAGICSSLKALMKRGESGVYLIDAEKYGEDRIKLLIAASVYCEICGTKNEGERGAAKAFEVIPGEPLAETVSAESYVPGGAFEKDAFVAVSEKSSSPLPWCFPLANRSFGTLVSDSSLGFSYYLNSRLNQITPWSNDYMSDNRGERLYAEFDGEYRDLIRGSLARFGKGYAEYHVKNGAVESETEVRVHGKLPVKIVRVSLRNRSEKRVGLRLAYYTEPLPDSSSQNMTYAYESEGLLFAVNRYRDGRGGTRSCLSCSCDAVYVTGKDSFFSGMWEAERAPGEQYCAAAVTDVALDAGEKKEVFFFLSAGLSERGAAYPHRLFSANPALCRDTANAEESAIRIRTPSENLDRLINFYLPYQAKVSRVLGRTGFSQNSGAYGFRDQLQDVCALLYSDPDLAKYHILKAASAQFEEGDVLHWWHKPPGVSGGFKGVRTRCSDDLFWLPYAVCEYVSVTDDNEILSKNVNFISGDNLLSGETERYISPVVSGFASVYEHCKRALNRGYRVGRHGLLLFGSGDWNDGMNGVGVKGKGESVWLSMFACVVMDRFIAVAESTGDRVFAQTLRERCASLKEALEKCWDSDRYIRGYHDDGEALGAAGCSECCVDSLPQSFSVFAGLRRDRAELAVDTAMKHLVDKERNIVKLFTPPYQSVKKNIGYIKRYPAGIRENGGQYTHAAVWLASAALRLGRVDDGFDILGMISPVTHSFEKAYKTEPYFLSADIYTARQAAGRGGWTIYTGAAGWYFRVAVEELLGLKKRGKKLYIAPSVPSSWRDFEISAVLDGTRLSITARRTGRSGVRVDGRDVEYVSLDGGEKRVEVEY